MALPLSTIDLAEIESACQQVLKLAIVGDTFWVDAILYEFVKSSRGAIGIWLWSAKYGND